MRVIWTEQADVVVAAYKASPEQQQWTRIGFAREEWGFTMPSKRVAAVCRRIEDYLAPDAVLGDITVNVLREYAARLERGVLGERAKEWANL